MAKDPAVLWYWGDWNSGTATLTRHLKGCYIDLLHAQFNSGPLSLEEIKIVLGADFAAWGTLQKKFTRTDDGLFFNERLENEKTKRKKFSQSRRDNICKRYDKSTLVDTSVVHMNLHMENENENRNKIDPKEGLLRENLPDKDWDSAKNTFLCDEGWIYKFCTSKQVHKDRFDQLAKEFLNDLELKQDYKDARGIRSHFTNWFAKYQSKNGTYQQSSNGHKRGTSEARIDAARNF